MSSSTLAPGEKHEDDRDHKTIMQQIGAWNLANTLKSNMEINSKATGSPAMPFIGKYTDNSVKNAGLPYAALGAALAAAGGLGAYLWSQNEDAVPPTPPPAITEPATDKEILVEGVIDWEFDKDAGFNAG